MEPLSFLSPNADNLFKFLFLNGVVMVAIGLFYPLQKSNDLQIRILEYNRKIELLEQNIIGFKDDSKNLNKIVESRIELAESLVEKRKNLQSNSDIANVNNQISELKLKTNISYQDIKKNQDKITGSQVNLRAEKKVIEQLKKQVAVYDSYCCWFLIIGIFLGIIGFIGWVSTTLFSEYANYKDFCEQRRKANRIKRRRKAIKAKSINNLTPQPPDSTPDS